MNVLLVADLSERTWSAHADLIDRADLCIPVLAANGVASRRAMSRGRWRVEEVNLFDDARNRHALWAQRFVQAQALSPRDRRLQDLLAYGLEFRLRTAAVARDHLLDACRARGWSLRDVDLDVVADDPYVRDTFARRAGWSRELKSVRLHGQARWSSLRRLSERAAGLGPVQQAVRAAARWRAVPGPSTGRSTPRGGESRTAALFLLNQRLLGMFEAIRNILIARGWRVPLVSYTGAVPSVADVQLFGPAPHDAGVGELEPRPPRWALGAALTEDSPVSDSWLRAVLNRSWWTGRQETANHLHLLRNLRPSVVASTSADTMGLALRAAAEALGIRSVFVNHGPQGPVPWSWFYCWSASAVSGWPCVEAGNVGPFGETHGGLVPVGYPPYDILLRRATEPRTPRHPLRDLGQPPERPYVVLVFAEFGYHYWVHVFQQRLLAMAAGALPQDCFLVCKLHPSGEAEREACEAALAAVLPRNAFVVVGERQARTPDLLECAAVAVATEQSMTLTDAIVVGCPPVGVRFPEMPAGSNDLGHPARGEAFWHCSRIVETAAGLREAVAALVHDPAARSALRAARKDYIERFYFASDGLAGHRVASLIEHLGEGGCVDAFVPSRGASLLETAAPQ